MGRGNHQKNRLDSQPAPTYNRAMDRAWLVFVAALRHTFHRIGLLLVVNMLWWLFSLPLLTWPPATAGLFYVTQRLTDVNLSEQTTWRHFFSGARMYWRSSWLLAAVNLAVIAIISLNLLFYLNRSQVIWRSIAGPVFLILLFWVAIQLYLFPILLAQKRGGIKLMFKNACILSIQNMGFTVVLGLLLLSVILISTTLAGPVFLILISFLAVAQTLALQEVLGQREEL